MDTNDGGEADWERRWRERGGISGDIEGLRRPEYLIVDGLPPLVALPAGLSREEREAAFRAAHERLDRLANPWVPGQSLPEAPTP